MTGLATACAEVPDLVRVEVLENKSLSRTVISIDAKSDLCVGSVPEFLFEDTRCRRLLWWCSLTDYKQVMRDRTTGSEIFGAGMKDVTC